MTSHLSIQNMMLFKKNTNGGGGREAIQIFRKIPYPCQEGSQPTVTPSQQNEATKLQL